MQTILAVAIGNPANSRTITDPAQLKGVRQYITGLVFYLSQQTNPSTTKNYAIGSDYTIDYQEWDENNGDYSNANTYDVIFCMSTPLVRKAKDYASKPIVGVFSDPTGEGFDKTNNVCGVNAQRIQNAQYYYDKFVNAISGLKSVYALHRLGNTASIASWALVHQSNSSVQPLKMGTGPGQDIPSLIKGVPAGSGIIVLPVDLFFGQFQYINELATAQNLPVFWPIPDLVPPGLVGYGVSQFDSGQAMGKLVQYILEHPNSIPTDSNRFISAGTAKWVASKAAAAALNVKLSGADTAPGLNIV